MRGVGDNLPAFAVALHKPQIVYEYGPFPSHLRLDHSRVTGQVHQLDLERPGFTTDLLKLYQIHIHVFPDLNQLPVDGHDQSEFFVQGLPQQNNVPLVRSLVILADRRLDSFPV